MKYEWRVLKCCVPSKWFCFECLLERREDKRTRTSHTHTERSERKQTWLWPTRLCRRHSCSLWRRSGRRRPGPRRADCWPGPPRQSGLRPFAIKAGNHDPEPPLPVCKSRASRVLNFVRILFFEFSRGFDFVCGREEVDTGGRMCSIEADGFRRKRQSSEREREKRPRNNNEIKMLVWLNFSNYFSSNSWKMFLSFVD